jgi:putative transposase
MSIINERPFTRRLRRLHEVYSARGGPALFFVTICSAGRRRLLANPTVHEHFRNFSETSPIRCSVWVGQYVIMPDHLHVFVSADGSSVLSRWVGSLKRHLSWCFSETGERPPYWQEGFFDHVLRGGESYSEKWLYVSQNPVRAGLVARVEDWSFQGMIHELRW